MLQVSWMEAHLLSRLKLHECLGCAFSKRDKQKRAPTVVAAIEHFNRLAALVATSVLRTLDLTARADVIVRFVDIMGGVYACVCVRDGKFIGTHAHTRTHAHTCRRKPLTCTRPTVAPDSYPRRVPRVRQLCVSAGHPCGSAVGCRLSSEADVCCPREPAWMCTRVTSKCAYELSQPSHPPSFRGL